MRVYVPLTPARLKQLTADGSLTGEGGLPLPAHGVTGEVREWYVEGDEEELEYTAQVEAAEACLSLLALDPSAARLRLVAAADVPDDGFTPGGPFRSSLTLRGPLALSTVVAFHVDEREAEPVVEAAVGALAAASNGDDDAQFLVDEAEGADLLWFDVSEIGAVEAAVSGPR